MPRARLDVALVERGLIPTRSRAQAAVLAGRVRVDGIVSDKPGLAVDDARVLEVEPAQEFVSRGGLKLRTALERFDVSAVGARALDLGASTGGFTDCLLAYGAAEVVAVDVGYGQLDWRLRNDPRVHVRERTNARHLTPETMPYAPDLVVSDLAFISTALVWTAIAPTLAPGWRALVLVKPQFEAGREHVGSSGVVRDREVRLATVRKVAAAIAHGGGVVCDACDSGVPGPKGNREVFLFAGDAAAVDAVDDVDDRIADAVDVGQRAETR
jgi:23S rRNA (cytidine1920-2'-O)/16S rRNA (cytidine1409-2'-O)-methyltransferase